MTWYSKYLKQTATYWAPSAVSGVYQTKTWTTPAVILVRWEDKRERFTDRGGEELVSNAVVYLNQEVLEGGFLFLGTSVDANPRNVSKAFPIKKFENTPGLKNQLYVRKAIL